MACHHPRSFTAQGTPWHSWQGVTSSTSQSHLGCIYKDFLGRNQFLEWLPSRMEASSARNHCTPLWPQTTALQLVQSQLPHAWWGTSKDTWEQVLGSWAATENAHLPHLFQRFVGLFINSLCSLAGPGGKIYCTVSVSSLNIFFKQLPTFATLLKGALQQNTASTPVHQTFSLCYLALIIYNSFISILLLHVFLSE